MQALTGLFARQFGTPNYAAHGGFCSVNMAAGMIYTIGGIVLGVRRARPRPREAVRDDRHRRGPSLESAEDRDLEVQARRRPLHLDQPGAHRLLGDRRRVDADPAGHRRRAAARADPRADRASASTTARSSRASPTPAAREPRRRRARRVRHCSCAGEARRPSDDRAPAQQARVVGPASRNAPVAERTPTAPIRALYGEFTLADGTPRQARVPAARRARRATARPSGRRRSPAFRRATIRRLAHEMGVTARDADDRAADSAGPTRGASSTRRCTGNPVAFHAMRGLAAHSNGFQTIRALAILMSAARHDRPAGRLPPQGAVPAARSRRSREAAQRPDAMQAEHAARRGAARLVRRARTICSSTTTARRCASTRRSRGSTRSRCTA